MTSTAISEVTPRFTSLQTESSQLLKSDSECRLTKTNGIGHCSSSYSGDDPRSSKGDIEDHPKGNADFIGQHSVVSSDKVPDDQSVGDTIEQEDGDDDVFTSTPTATEFDQKLTGGHSNADSQYDELSTFASSFHQDVIQLEPSSKCHLDNEPSKHSPASTVCIRNNTSTSDSSPNSMEATTSSIVDFTHKDDCIRHLQQHVVLDACSFLAESSTGIISTGISLFEKLVRTHPIWYMPHIGRVAAVHLLRGKAPGVFIVRRSSHPNSMAISIKLPPGSTQDIEHYLIETTLAGVHLEGSPNYFRELPFLLAYYCENGDELHTTLTLPKVILECESLRDLGSLALLGPEFWTSHHCTADPDSVTDPTKEIPCASEVPRAVDQDRMRKGVVQTNTERQVASVNRRSLSISGYPVGAAKSIISGNSATISEEADRKVRKPIPFPRIIKDIEEPTSSSKDTASKIQTSRERPVLAKFRSESIGGNETTPDDLIKNQVSSEIHQERRSFRLRNLFEMGRRPSPGCARSPSVPKEQNQRKFGSLTTSKPKKPKQMAAFVNSNSTITSTETDSQLPKSGPQHAVFYVHGRPAPPPPSLRPSSPPVSSKSLQPSTQVACVGKQKIDGEYYYFTPTSFPSPSLDAALSESRSVSSLLQEPSAGDERQRSALETPTMSRKRLLTFKPGSPTIPDENATPTAAVSTASLERSKGTKPHQALPNEKGEKINPQAEQYIDQSLTTSMIRPTFLRREKSDLGRLYGNNGKVTTHAEHLVNQQQRQAILPPESREDTFKTCVEELRKRRLDALKPRPPQLAPPITLLHSRRDGSAHFVSTGFAPSLKPCSSAGQHTIANSSAFISPGSGNVTVDHLASPSNGVLRTKSIRQHGVEEISIRASHRLSAPNLVELSPNPSSPTSMLSERRTVVELLREIRARQTKVMPNSGGGLHTINEGLVTPMARRRWIAHKRHADGSAERRLSQSLEDLPTATSQDNPGTIQPTIQPPVSSKERSSSDRKHSFSKTNIPVRRQESNQTAPSSSVSAISTTINRRNEKAFHDETNFQWVAVTNEIRQKQKVAKVAPTRNRQLPQLNCGTTSRNDNKFNDYVMLNECAEMLQTAGTQGQQNEEAEYGNGRYGSIGGIEFRRHDSNCFNSNGHNSNFTNSQQPEVDIDDTRSVVSTAGTVFNEPWDSSVWENLLTLASTMDNDTNGPVTIDGPSSRTISASSDTSSQRPFRIDKASPVKEVVGCKDGNEKAKGYPKTCHTRHATAAWTERLKKLKENNIPPPLAPNWEEFSSHVPMSSNSSLPTSTPTNSLESKRKSLLMATGGMKNNSGGKKETFPSTTSNTCQDDDAALIQDRFIPAPVPSPVRFRNDAAASTRRGDRAKRRQMSDPGAKIQDCVENLAKDIQTFFGAQVQYFVKCTTEGHETDPLIVLGNVRQFMNGLKNYLVKHGECDLHPLIEQERSKLRPTEFLNIDAILEGVLQKIILSPLKPHLYHLLIKDASTNGSLESLSENLGVIRSRPLAELGIHVGISDASTFEHVQSILRKMKHHYSPLKKLEYLLQAVALAYDNCQAMSSGSNMQHVTSSMHLPCADELLRWFVYLISRCSFILCEVESLYIWHLLHPALLAGEASYYLTAFSSAIHVLKHVDLLPKLNDTCSLSSQMGDAGEGFIKVAVPDEIRGAIRYHGFPIMPQLTVSRLCRLIARKCGITNPEDYGLYLLIDGYETCLLSSECPEMVKEHLRTANKAHLFAYKRHEAKIAWPKIAVSPRL